MLDFYLNYIVPPKAVVIEKVIVQDSAGSVACTYMISKTVKDLNPGVISIG